MNIHISDVDLFNNLRNSTIFNVEIGSRLYKINDEFSDIDILNIYSKSDKEINSFNFSHHQLQYKENNVDYIFLDLFNFIRNLLTGDSTINFEVIHSDKIKNSDLNFLYEQRKSFYNYKIMRSYLGFSRRDLKQYLEKSSDRDKNKKLIHAYRGYLFFNKIYNGDFDLNFTADELSEISNIRNFKLYSERSEYSKYLTNLINEKRNILTKDLENNKVIKFMDVKNQKLLDEQLYLYVKSDKYTSKKLKDINLELFYNANENDIIY
jgi:hypothetical protein